MDVDVESRMSSSNFNFEFCIEYYRNTGLTNPCEYPWNERKKDSESDGEKD